MKAIKICKHLIILDNITRVTFDENDVNFTADNQCAIYFVGDASDPMVFRGEDARSAYEKIEAALEIVD